MENLKRTPYTFFFLEETGFIDISLFFQGVAEMSSARRLLSVSILRRRAEPLTFDEARLLHEVPASKWTPAGELAERLGVGLEVLRDLAARGLLLSDADEEGAAELRRRDELLTSTQWNLHAALYHFMTKWEDMHLRINLPADLQELKRANDVDDQTFERFVQLFGEPPDHFHSAPGAHGARELPLVKREGQLYEALLRRKTTRAYDERAAMRLEDLSAILYYVWGCHGISRVWRHIMGLKKTSPSGGDLHPTEVYPLVTNVEGLEPGLYHYNVRDHSLELLRPMARAEAGELANEFTAGQSYPRAAHVSFVMTSRFYRNFWKYRQHQKSYSVTLMDAAHLSQTFYLVCTEMGLGAYVTAAINGVNIERVLGLDGVTEGAILMCGCGVPLEDLSLDPEFEPYAPRRGH